MPKTFCLSVDVDLEREKSRKKTRGMAELFQTNKAERIIFDWLQTKHSNGKTVVIDIGSMSFYKAFTICFYFRAVKVHWVVFSRRKYLMRFQL